MSSPKLPDEEKRLLDESAAIQKNIERKALDDTIRKGQLNVVKDIIASAIYDANYYKKSSDYITTNTLMKISTAILQYRHVGHPEMGLSPM